MKIIGTGKEHKGHKLEKGKTYEVSDQVGEINIARGLATKAGEKETEQEEAPKAKPKAKAKKATEEKS
jgi:hypothetical protein